MWASLVTKLIAVRLEQYVEAIGILLEEQCAFRSKEHEIMRLHSPSTIKVHATLLPSPILSFELPQALLDRPLRCSVRVRSKEAGQRTFEFHLLLPFR
jgi:hypothetical protein